MIDGGVTVSIEEGDNEEEIIAKVKEATKETMDDDELLTDDNPEVEKVKYLEDEEEEEEETNDGAVVIPPIGKPPPVSNGTKPLPMILGAASVGILALLALGGLMVKKKKPDETNPVMPSRTDSCSFVVADGKKLGQHASCMDVHECKSAFCQKCYVDRSIMFVGAPITPRPPPSTPASTQVFQEMPPGVGWDEINLDSSSFESSSTTNFY